MADENEVRARARERLLVEMGFLNGTTLVLGSDKMVTVRVADLSAALWRTPDDDLRDEVVEAVLGWAQCMNLSLAHELVARAETLHRAERLLEHRS